MVKKDTIEYKIVSLIGLSGEVQTEDLYRLKYGQEYIRKTISRLISNGYIKTYKYENIKCLRLTTKCKKYLKENFPERFSDTFIGASSTNKIRNDVYRRSRYHKLGKILILLDGADVKIFADEKNLMKKSMCFTRADDTDLLSYSSDKSNAEFYTSVELKAAGLFMNARTSRALGIIFSYPDVYIVYNVSDGIIKWESKIEDNFFYRVKHIFLGDKSENFRRYPKVIFVGNSMDAMLKILNDRNKDMRKMLAIGSDYDNIFFLDSSKFASQQLKYFVDGKMQSKVNKEINDDFSVSTKVKKYYSEMADGTMILNCTNCNLASMRFVKEAGIQKGRKVNIICFHIQLPYLQEYFSLDDNVEYYQMDSTGIL